MFAKLSKEITSDVRIQIDNAFFVDFMPYAPESYVKVYLYGLSLAYTGVDGENTDAEIARALGIDVSVVNEAFSYWQNCGVINVLSTTPVSVEYLPVSKHTLALRKFSKTKYKDFNDQLHAMFPSRNILPNEYNEYYSIMEAMHIEPTAMLAIIAYSIRQKGENVTYPYILAVARNLAHQGCITFDRVNEQLSEFDLYDKDMLAVMKALGTKKSPSLEDKRLFKKWTKTLGFTVDVIIKVAKTVKKGGIDRLDALVTRYYENNLFTIDEIEIYNQNRERMYKLIKEINRRIGVYYEQLDYLIETYVVKWLGLGFEEETLLTIADYCLKRGIKTLEGVNETVDKFYKQGLLTEDAICDFMGEVVRRDGEIREVLEEAGIDRPVSSRDRDAYRIWTYTWKMPKAVIMYAAKLSRGNPGAIAYMNGILGAWQRAGITTVEAASTYKPSSVKTENEKGTVTKTYTSEQLNAMFDNLDYEDL